jgi:hypothetical protein
MLCLELSTFPVDIHKLGAISTKIVRICLVSVDYEHDLSLLCAGKRFGWVSYCESPLFTQVNNPYQPSGSSTTVRKAPVKAGVLFLCAESSPGAAIWPPAT